LNSSVGFAAKQALTQSAGFKPVKKLKPMMGYGDFLGYGDFWGLPLPSS
jgi:hypothetical protein